MPKPYYAHGDQNAICDVCGFQYKASELLERWDGAMVCIHDFEYRHPQDFIRVPRTESVPEWSRPVPQDVFRDVPIDCNTFELVRFDPSGKIVREDTTLYKAFSYGPITIDDGVTVDVVCSWTIY